MKTSNQYTSEVPTFDQELYPQQKEALDRIDSFLNSDDSVFILRGYAGTGKTTMIKAVLPIISRKGKYAQLMAPTGRAAKILHQKTQYPATTIHKAIYALDKLTAKRHDESGNLIKTATTQETDISHKDDVVEFWFDISDLDNTTSHNPSQYVFIIDEASMISSQKVEPEIFHFGTDILLEDLLTYAKLGSKSKIIFIGDPAQLPPVGDSESKALNEEFFINKGWATQSYDLTEVVRQSADSLILKNAMTIRTVLEQNARNSLIFSCKENEFERISSTMIPKKFVDLYPEPTMGAAAIVCYSNSMAKGYNDAIRNYYYPGKTSVQCGDILQVVRNCYMHERALFNGDFVRVIGVSDSTETQSARVWTSVGGSRIHQLISLKFRDVVVQSEEGEIYKMKIIDSLLNDTAPRLSVIEHTALYINFRMRHPELRNDHEAMAKALLEDPYYSALNVKYGYAITGHKSQGGDWNTVFVDYSDRVGLNDDALRWMYTATTRAKNILYGVNIPNIHPLEKLKFNPIIKFSKPAKDSLMVADIGGVDTLPNGATNIQKAKYFSIVKALNSMALSVKRVEFLPYKDRYHIEVGNRIIRYDCTYNGAGHYTKYTAIDVSDNDKSILMALQAEGAYIFNFDYEPSTDYLTILYHKVRSICSELGIVITNVVEEIKQYDVVYFLRTSGKFSQIKFYYNKNGFVTYGQPYSDVGEDDELLNELIKKLS